MEGGRGSPKRYLPGACPLFASQSLNTAYQGPWLRRPRLGGCVRKPGPVASQQQRLRPAQLFPFSAGSFEFAMWYIAKRTRVCLLL